MLVWSDAHSLNHRSLVGVATVRGMECRVQCVLRAPFRGLATQRGRPKAQFYGTLLVGLGLTETIVVIVLIPPFKSETLPAGLRWLCRFVLALLLVVGSIAVVAYGLSATGHYLK